MIDKPKIQKICELASLTAETLIRKDVDNVNSLTRDCDGWVAEVEVLERKAVPDTQDLLGRYEMRFDAEGELLGFRRIMIRRRSDLEAVEEEVCS